MTIPYQFFRFAWASNELLRSLTRLDRVERELEEGLLSRRAGAKINGKLATLATTL